MGNVRPVGGDHHRRRRFRIGVVSFIAERRRATELRLVIFAGVITASAYTLASLGKNSVIPPRILPFLAVLLLVLVSAHIAVRLLAPGADSTLLPVAAMLNGLGYVMIARLSERLAGLQTTWTLIGIIAFTATLIVVRRVNDLARFKWTYFAVGAGLLLLPMVPGLGFSSGGARIWVSVGPVNFQPGEFAKIALALFFAAYLAESRELIKNGTWRVGRFMLPEPRDLLPLLAAWGFSVVLMVGQKDLGSSLLFFTLFIVMVWIATEKAAFMTIGLGLFAMSATVAYFLFDHVQTRVSIWLDPWESYRGRGYQIAQSMFALGSGGLGGTGLGLGDPTRIPEAKNDFIFAAIGEELGLFGATAILIAFLLIIGAGLRTAMRAKRDFAKLLAIGLTTIVGVQAFIIVGGVIRVVPLTGITLPFVSYGGSSLVANYVLLALLLRISDNTAKRLGEAPDQMSAMERFEAARARRRTARTGAAE
ncbi:MAG: FtsW/RodA/SpoVE family cell cycle protein [Actinobacteria bacterium]|nr:FtsW/RodA/SpoVE family cell cycle protein [Actinomycetota bacterium]